MIVANQVGEDKAFDKDINQIEIIWNDGQISLPEQTKKLLAIELMKIITERFKANN